MAPSSSARPVPAPRAPSPRDTAWLEAFEEHLRHERNRSPQTARAYLADLRALIDHVAGTAGNSGTPALDDDAPVRRTPSAPDVLAELDIEDLRGWLAAMSGAGLARATLA
ncbi:site-specific integrase, partial [Micrococcus luteus]